MDYGLLPPEIHSARMYSGPGAGSLLAAAASWGNVADGLDETADGFRSVTAMLTSGWQGHSAIAMTQAAASYLSWLHAAAVKGGQAAAHATAAATAYDEAHAAMVPPSVINANRTHRRSLAQRNATGQDTETIAAMDADYELMWAQDVEAMYAYAAASAAASRVAPFTSAPPALDVPVPANQELAGDPEVISAGSQLISVLPQALQALSSFPLTALDVALASVSASLARLTSLSIPVKFPMHLLSFLGAGPKLPGGLAGLGRKVLSGPTVKARWGDGSAIGRLSVPPAWGKLEPPSPVRVDFHVSKRRMRTIGGRAVNGSLVYS